MLVLTIRVTKPKRTKDFFSGLRTLAKTLVSMLIRLSTSKQLYVNLHLYSRITTRKCYTVLHLRVHSWVLGLAGYILRQWYLWSCLGSLLRNAWLWLPTEIKNDQRRGTFVYSDFAWTNWRTKGQNSHNCLIHISSVWKGKNVYDHVCVVTIITEAENALEVNFDLSPVHIPNSSALRPELGILDPHDGDAFLYEAGPWSRYQSGKILRSFPASFFAGFLRRFLSYKRNQCVLISIISFQNGAMTALPYLAMYLLSFPFGYITDFLPNKGWLTITATRKLSNSIGITSI